MGRICLVPLCEARDGPGLNNSFYKLPKNFVKRAKWVTALRNMGTSRDLSSPCLFVCHRHFCPILDFREDRGRTSLKSDAIPRSTKELQEIEQNNSTVPEEEEEEPQGCQCKDCKNKIIKKLEEKIKRLQDSRKKVLLENRRLKRKLTNKSNQKKREVNNFICDCCKEQFPKSTQIKEENDPEVAELTSVIVKEEEMLYNEDIQVVATQNIFKENDVSLSEAKFFKCNECMKEFSEKSKLRLHYLKIHTEEKPFKCNECTKTYSHKSSLVSHERTHERTYKLEKPFKCGICLKDFSKKCFLVDHMRMHTGEKPFKCENCQKAFSLKSSLVSHERTHDKTHGREKPFQCGICLKGFSKKCILVEHMRMHTGEKPFKCEHCLKAFSQKGNLTNHIRIHTAEKSFKCEICSQAFSRKSYLILHLKIHTGEKPFKCGECLREFSQKSSLNRHMIIHT